MTQDLSGILVALVTPFSDDGATVDLAALSDLVERQIAAGVHGLVPGGSTGEFTSLSIEERQQVVETCVKAADGRVPVVAGVGAMTTSETVALAEHAAGAGASALMIVPPYYEPLTVDEIKDHLGAAHQASGLPIVYYNLPAVSGARLSAQELADLSEVEGVRYLKDTSGDAVSLTELLVKHRDRMTAFNGWDTLTFYGLAMGAKGSVWGVTNFIPELSVQLWDAVAVRGDLAEGRRLWDRIWPICDFLESVNYGAAVKAGLDLVGHSAGPVRAPFRQLGEEERQRLGALLSEAGVI